MERNFPHKEIDDFTRVISPIELIKNKWSKVRYELFMSY